MSLLTCTSPGSAGPKDPWFSKVKPIHATISFTSPLALHDMLIGVCKLDHAKSTTIALDVTAAVCIGKEWLDSRKGGSGWSWKDLSYDAAGLLGTGTVMIAWRR